MAVDIGAKIDALHEELVLIRARLEALEGMLSEEEASEDDRAASSRGMVSPLLCSLKTSSRGRQGFKLTKK